MRTHGIKTGFIPALALLALGPGAARLATAQTLGTNLIVNGNAEAGPAAHDAFTVVPVPGWDAGGTNFTVVQYGSPGEFPSASDPGPADRGKNFFAGGPDNSFSQGKQVIDVSALAAPIDTGTLPYTFSAYLGGFDSSDDFALLESNFHLDFMGGGGFLGVGTLVGPLAADRGNQTGLFLVSTNGLVPAGTRSIEVVQSFTRTTGAGYNHGFVDDISLVLGAPVVPEPGPVGLLLSGLVPLGLVIRRSKKKSV